jgi:diguanylate cyclase (GGDEF)-like protein
VNLRLSLRRSLLLAFALSLAMVLVFQSLARVFIELPALYAQEHAGDVHAVEQVRRAFALNLAHLQAVTEDNAHWLGAYKFMGMEKDGVDYNRFAEVEYGHADSMHVIPRVNGYAYFRPDGEVFFESTYDLRDQSEGPSLPLSLNSLRKLLPSDRPGAVAGGFVDSALGPLQLVIAGITDDAATLQPNGYMVIWRKFDELFLQEFVEPLGANIRLSSLDATESRVQQLLRDRQGVLPRDAQGNTHWLIEDITGQPLLLVSQATRPRVFNDSLLSASSVVGFSSSALLLALLSLFVTRSVIRPIVDTSVFIEAVTNSNDFSRRLSIHRDDEVGVVVHRFNDLLARVESQEEALKLQNAQLEEMADRDALTGLHNRRVFERALARNWSMCLRSGSRLTCMMLDVDCFKSYNDHYGHPAGDDALQQIVRVLEGHAQRAGDCLCRYGGEEFVVLLPETDAEAATKLAARMVADVANLALPHAHSDCAEVITMSAGVATVTPRQCLGPDSLVNRADQALYEAKHAGRNRVVRANSEKTKKVSLLDP